MTLGPKKNNPRPIDLNQLLPTLGKRKLAYG